MQEQNRLDHLKIYAGSLAGAVSLLKWSLEHDGDMSIKLALDDVVKLTNKIKDLI